MLKLHKKRKITSSNIQLKKLKQQLNPWTVFNTNPRKDLQIISSFAVLNGVYYYEIELVNGGNIRLGWVTRFAYVSDKNKLKMHDENSVVNTINNLKPKTVLGCLINVDNKTTTFFKNEKKEKMEKNKNFFKFLPAFAYVSIDPFIKVNINFGQKKFKKFFKKSENITSFFHESNQIDYIFKLKFSNFKWFCSRLKSKYYIIKFNQNKINFPPRYQDFTQNQIDKIVLQMEEMINIDFYNVNTIVEKTFNKISKIANSNKNIFFLIKYHIFQRVFQSVIETIGLKTCKSKFDKLFLCIFWLLKKTQNSNPSCICFHSVILHYTNNLKIKTKENRQKIRIFCHLLIPFITKSDSGLHDMVDITDCCTYIYNKKSSFLLNVLLESTDLFSQLISFLALEKIHFDFSGWYGLVNQTFFLEMNQNFVNWINQFSHDNECKYLENITKQSIRLQLNLCVNNHYLKYYFKKSKFMSNDNQSLEKPSFLQMNPQDKSYYYMKLSPSNLMVRSDESWLTTCRSKFYIVPSVFYFEVTLVTSGEMRIGFATKQMKIKEEVGSNALSIGIDGFNGCVWMSDKKYKIKSFQSEWKTGDVVGVYFDGFNKSITFGINQIIAELESDPFEEEEFVFSVLKTYVAVSMGKHQQCYFNFNCTTIPLVFYGRQSILSGPNCMNISSSMVLYGLTGNTTMGNFSVNGKT